MDAKLHLLFVTGDRVHITLNNNLFKACGFDEANNQMFRVGDLRQYIYEDWTEVVSHRENHGSESLVDITARPQSSDCIQLLHLGKRLDPNSLVSSMNLDLSEVVHILVKPYYAVPETSQNKKRLDRFTSQIIKVKSSKNRRGSTSNTPVPAFVTSAATAMVAGSLHNGSFQSTTTSASKRSLERSSEETGTPRDDVTNITATNQVDQADPVELVDPMEPEAQSKRGSDNQSIHICPASSHTDNLDDIPPSFISPSDVQFKEKGGCCIIM
ncbi:hypothetical protein FOA43_000968 [Brettanomyces nanus]|uniref:Uncharacterized protein n=1 Tax=Eeniella nana TaxID=13502 RepID=A0A875S019_EENNA|nr:uncharacterized protein FOA43_000968 [Brettanomyces nanus]QPG73655.1 hypothetical protein FOA43_000968 [Brettanomyces nanus]